MNRRGRSQQAQSRALAGFLCGLHHSALCFLRRALRLCQGRSRRSRRRSPQPSTPRSSLSASFPSYRSRHEQQRTPSARASERSVTHHGRSVSAGKVKARSRHIRQDLDKRSPAQIAQRHCLNQMGRDGLVISLREAGFFDSGSAIPRPETLTTLRQIGQSLAARPTRCASRATPKHPDSQRRV